MPRRGTELVQSSESPKKKNKLLLDPSPSLDVSFCDDEALPPGIVFTDIQQKKWRIGKPIGRGSFGRIYLASDDVDNEVTKSSARYVVKIEPHTNGPLFVEIHCLIRTAVVSKVRSWRHKNTLKSFGMPIYIASGSFTDEKSGIKYRFLVLPRYDIDLQKIIARTKVLDVKNVSVLAIQILNVLEYLHGQGYTHSDIKSSNLILGFDGGKWNKSVKPKPTQSFQKDTKEVPILSGKFRRVKMGKGRTSNYYDDEDFTVKEYKNADFDENHLDNIKNKLRKILSEKDKRALHRHHAFNLRQLSNDINYEDMTSSVCSDQSYQKLLDDFGSIIQPENFEFINNGDEIHQEAVVSQSNGQIYLLDYGLASKFLDSEGNHKDFAMDARKAHDGTLEYSSRDSHIGAHSRRSDLETLGYNLIDWLTGTLPWKTSKVLTEPDLVHALKKNYMSDIKHLLKTCFKAEFYPKFIEKYFEYITKLDFSETPDYDYCRSLFKSELLKNGYDKNTSLNFDDALLSPINRKKIVCNQFARKNTPPDFIARNGIKKAYERENVCLFESDLKLELIRETLNSSSDGVRKPCASRNFFISDADLIARLKKSLIPHEIVGKKLSPKNLRSTKKKVPKKRGRNKSNKGKFGNFLGSARQFTWAEILARNPEDIIRKERHISTSDDEDDDTCKYRIRKLSNASETSNSSVQSPLLQKDYLQGLNPTYAMKEIIANLKKKTTEKNKKEPESDDLVGYTPIMKKYHRIKEKREAKEKLDALKLQSSEKKEYIQNEARCTRSMKTKSVISPPKPKTNGKKMAYDKNKSDEKPREAVKRNTRTNTRSEKNKEVDMGDAPKSPEKKKTVRPNSETILLKMRLRSSKRQKQWCQHGGEGNYLMKRSLDGFYQVQTRWKIKGNNIYTSGSTIHIVRPIWHSMISLLPNDDESRNKWIKALHTT